MEKVYDSHPAPYTLHRRSHAGVYTLMGEFETDYVEFAFRDCIQDHTGSRVWVTDKDGIIIESYDPDHDDYLDFA